MAGKTRAGRAGASAQASEPALPPAGEPPGAAKRGARLSADERRRSIIQAAQEVFSRSSFHGARTRDVADAAAVNQATLFQHFRTKEELFEQAVIAPLVETMRGLDERARSYRAADTPEALAEAAGPAIHRYAEVFASIFPLLTAALFSDREQGSRFYREQILPFLTARAAAFGPHVRDAVDPETLALVNFGIMFAIVLDQEYGDGRRDLDAVLEQVVRLAARAAPES
jgi:AcrR family transcriptional regulator